MIAKVRPLMPVAPTMTASLCAPILKPTLISKHWCRPGHYNARLLFLWGQKAFRHKMIMYWNYISSVPNASQCFLNKRQRLHMERQLLKTLTTFHKALKSTNSFILRPSFACAAEEPLICYSLHSVFKYSKKCILSKLSTNSSVN